jgi:hypothetical protein
MDYNMRLAEWGQQFEKAVEEATEEYMFATIVLIQCEYETMAIENRFRKIPFSWASGAARCSPTTVRAGARWIG